ncbi:UDP-4-amino-4,6-dideoxy-N-acetyl-beta-L-altrosamine transaminase [Paraneptunicella aestuarii]|uniref:UDP-4-amino-4, 6-dideoxy-N-acetyl-beta-L-altrosamine transaminase n=1 Tax=Paraneptunicella aestuarii TaxID=2831148 RepID=UPI001E283CCF|nr:UDP-4-amino-4,6-dideoxy-N-acetyl-beta-L-altrosamine transaminase [Paraneptunicella aestuarii]UAA39495.1 UDP-4-amino-4,6-dideoxy-N-acetyl-beta-L-altrosamine transaminase [Paraneptunicella aestuarii]
MIPYGKHCIDQSDIDAVVDVLENQFLTQGQMGPKFEKAICDYVGAEYCTVVNSGTSALHIACLAAGVGQGDLVWTSPISFAASANCARYCGADVDFVDIDPVTRNLCIDKLSAKLSLAQQNNRLPKAIVVVHFTGASCDMQAIQALTQPLGIVLIEDAAHALGATYQGRNIGSCQYSDMTILSFHPVKAVTTAEGGAVTSNNAHYAKLLGLYAKHGITRQDLINSEEHEGEGWFYEQQLLGYNYRLSDIHAALGLSQLQKLDGFISRRREQARFYDEALSALPLKLPEVPAYTDSAWHIYVVELLQHDRKKVFQALQAKQIGVNVHYIPIHLHPYYQELGFKPGDFPVAEKYYKMALTLPLFPTLSREEQEYVVQSLKEVLS